MFLLSGNTANLTFFLHSCAPAEFWCLLLSQTAQQTIALLFHISFLLGRQQIISYSFAFQTCPDWPERRSLSRPATSPAQQGTWHSLKKNSSSILCFPFPRHQAVHQLCVSLLLCCRLGSSLHGQPCSWQSPFQMWMATAPCYRTCQRATGPRYSIILYWGMPSTSININGRIKLSLDLATMSMLAGYYTFLKSLSS